MREPNFENLLKVLRCEPAQNLGGNALENGNSITDYIPFENYMAMRHATVEK